MAKCVRCGAHGLRIKLDVHGWCENCLRIEKYENRIDELTAEIRELESEVSKLSASASVNESKRIEAEHRLRVFEMEHNTAALNLTLTQAKIDLEKRKNFAYICHANILQHLDGRQFELFMGKLLEMTDAYTDVTVTQASTDRGGDILATDKMGDRVCIQCKHTKSKPGISAVQEAYTAMAYYETKHAIVITTADGYTQEAMEVAKKIGVWLVDNRYVSDLMDKFLEETMRMIHEEPALIESMVNNILDEAPEVRNEGYDPRLPEAIQIAMEAGYTSTSIIQRRMRTGYARAGRIIDQLEQLGVISEADGAKPRNVLITQDQLHRIYEKLGVFSD